MKKIYLLQLLLLTCGILNFSSCEEPEGPLPPAITITEDTTICYSDIINWHGQTVDRSSKVYYDTIRYKNSAADSVYYILNVTIHEEETTIIEETTIRSCDTIIWHGQYVNADKLVYYDTIHYENSLCDSIHYILNVTVVEYIKLEPTGSLSGYDYVDLGLSVPWATCNVGAKTVDQVGNYYSWATTQPYDVNVSNNYDITFNPYTLDNVLSAKYDAVSSNWGNSWRMPTQQEFKELKENCKWIWVDNLNGSGVAGYVAISKINSNAIFLPAGAYYKNGDYSLSADGSGFYWTSEISAGDVTTSATAVDFVIKSNNYQQLDLENKAAGLTVRGVLAPANEESLDFTPSGSKDGHDYVDLGLSVKWAVCNLGANSKDEVGDYYAWQETTPANALTAINYQINFNPCNPETNILSSKYDAARMNWGKEWRMPTYEEQKELCDNCTWRFVDDFQGTGVSGCIIKSKTTNKAIFLPVTGLYTHDTQQIIEKNRGYYWSSFAGPGDLWKGLISAISLTFYEGLNFRYGGTWDASARAAGLAIRAVVGHAEEYIPEGPFTLDETETSAQGVSVSGKQEGHTYVDLGLPSRTLWATYNVGGSKPGDYGNYYAWGETEPKDYYWDTTYKFYDGMNGRWYRYNKYTWFTEHHGTIDGKFFLEPEDDAATQNMGSSWCMPTRKQLEELCNYVQWTDQGTYYLGRSKTNGNTMILPKAGWEYGTTPNTHNFAWYWSSELMEATRDGSDYYAYQLIDSPEGGLMVKDAMRIQGLAVRAVVKK